MKLFPITSLLFLAAASSAFSLPFQTRIGGGAQAKYAGRARSLAQPFASPTSLAGLSYRESGYYDGDIDAWDSYGYGGGSGRRNNRNRSYDYQRRASSGVLARRRDGAYGSGYGRYYDDEFGYSGGFGRNGDVLYDDLTPREFTPRERQGIRRLQQRRYGGGDYSRGDDYYDRDDYFGGRRGGRREGWRGNYPQYGYGRGGRRGRRYGRAGFDDGFGYGGSYSYGGYGRGRERGRNYDFYDDYDDYGDYYSERSNIDDQRYFSRRGRRNQGFEQWGNLVGGAARRSVENIRGRF